MDRTQIYLSEAQTEALDRRARRTGLTRSQLIREAIDQVYRTSRHDRDEVLDAIRRAAGAWRGRDEAGAQYVERVRRGRLARLHRS